MFVHSVYFWLKPELSVAEHTALVADMHTLREVPSVRTGYIGTPAPTERPVIDSSYHYALVLVFDDKAGHDAYQEHPIHRAFADKWRTCWQVKIYDCQED